MISSLCLLFLLGSGSSFLGSFAFIMTSSASNSVSELSVNVMNASIDNTSSISCPKHLIVVSHGLMGTAYDLSKLSQFLEQGSPGCSVLLSTSNEFTKSLRGIKVGATSLVDEILHYLQEKDSQEISYECISFVGNSLGGLFARYAIKLLFSHPDFINRNIRPKKFLTIATPHLGVYHYNFLESRDIKIPFADDYIKKTVGSLFSTSGRDMFDAGNSSLLYHMATSEEFLIPLRQFKQRRLYANLRRDSVVPLGAAAFLPKLQVKGLKEKHRNESGFVYSTATGSQSQQGMCQQNVGKEPPSSSSVPDSAASSSSSSTHSIHHDCKTSNILSLPSHEIADAPYLIEMILALDTIGWEKFVVNFTGGWYPLAHNKLCALTRQPAWLYEKVLGFDEGLFVMKHAADWLLTEIEAATDNISSNGTVTTTTMPDVDVGGSDNTKT